MDIGECFLSNRTSFSRFLAISKITDAVVSSQKATAQLLHKQHESQHEAKFEKLEGYTCDAEVRVSPADIEKIKKILQSPSSYRWNVASSCIPDYGVLLNFHSDQRSVQVALCFNCDLMAVFSGEETPIKRVSTGTIFTPRRAQLVPMMKTLFPNDRNIQELKPDRD